jgi:hypothetical protein
LQIERRLGISEDKRKLLCQHFGGQTQVAVLTTNSGSEREER